MVIHLQNDLGRFKENATICSTFVRKILRSTFVINSLLYNKTEKLANKDSPRHL